MERPSQLTLPISLTGLLNATRIRHQAIRPANDSETNPTGHSRTPANFRYFGNPVLGETTQLLCWIISPRSKTRSKLQLYRSPNHLQIFKPLSAVSALRPFTHPGNARYALFSPQPLLGFSLCEALLRVSARLPHSESPARLRPAFATPSPAGWDAGGSGAASSSEPIIKIPSSSPAASPLPPPSSAAASAAAAGAGAAAG
jgi:hypothetical protein